ncbi:LPXTG-motif cell wall-anchored protein [Haloactinopolyspora alba]|uniref:LPXTG-motif cell wall-anchored protein n=1 Tax=Haloactinopolyspora alba TaxID=648780 RepID=A0A2P8DNC1_9ACTN|nr:LPXTG-motif cell wall-anchored protein [Haloactinopolyspora alba]
MLPGLGAVGAGVLLAGLAAAPAVAQETGVVLDVTADEQVVGAPGDVVEVSGSAVNSGTEDMVGGIVDFEVPAGAEIVGVVGQEIQEGTERPAEGCALETPQRLVCGTEATLAAGDSTEATFEVKIADDAAAGELGVATTLAEGNNGGSGTAETVITVAQEGVALDVTADEQVRAAAGDVVEISNAAANTGTEAIEGGIVDFEVPEGAEIVGVVGQEIQEGTERPAEGCALETPRKLVCGTQGTVSPGQVNEATYEVKIADDAATGELGVATTLAEGNNGGSDSAETVITVAEEGVALDVTADEQVEGAPGDVVEVNTVAEHVGTEDLVGGIVDFEVPAGAEVVGIVGQEFVEGTERPAEGCALVTPQRVECHTEATLAAGDSSKATFEVKIADDATAGELGVATTLAEGDNGGSDSAETVLTVAGTEEPTQEPTSEPTTEPTAEPTAEPTSEPTEEPTAEPTAEPTSEPTDDTGAAGTESGEDDLPDTGSSSTSALLAAAGLLLVGGAAVALRARRS